MAASSHHKQLEEQWQKAWPKAVALWSPFAQLQEPIWCLTAAQEKKEKLHQSFAMIRFTDHRVVISLRQVAQLKLGKYSTEILAHEVGHHIHAPANLSDHSRLIAKMRKALGSQKNYAPLIANLYTDLLINDRLQRIHGLNMAGVYQDLRQAGLKDKDNPKEAPKDDVVWMLYMRIYERLWRLSSGTLAQQCPPELDAEADLGARIIRVYRDRWLIGAGRFAMLFRMHLMEMKNKQPKVPPWMDTHVSKASINVCSSLFSTMSEWYHLVLRSIMWKTMTS